MTARQTVEAFLNADNLTPARRVIALARFFCPIKRHPAGRHGQMQWFISLPYWHDGHFSMRSINKAKA